MQQAATRGAAPSQQHSVPLSGAPYASGQAVQQNFRPVHPAASSYSPNQIQGAPMVVTPSASNPGPSTGPKTMRAQHAGSQFSQPVYSAHPYHSASLPIQYAAFHQQMQPQSQYPAAAPHVRAPVHHYFVPPPQPPPPGQHFPPPPQPSARHGKQQPPQQQRDHAGRGPQNGSIMRPQQLPASVPRTVLPAPHLPHPPPPTQWPPVPPHGTHPPSTAMFLMPQLSHAAAASAVHSRPVAHQPPPASHHIPPGTGPAVLGGAGGGPRAVLKAPFSEGGGRFGGGGKKQKKKKDMVLPVEKLTQDPTPRAPQNEAERVEVDEWIKERRKHFPTTSNMAKKEQELKERAARGELEVLREERRRRLHDIIARQQSMGLARAAGTQDMFFAMSRGGGRGGREARGRGRRGGGRGRGPRPFGYEVFMQAGDAPQQQQQVLGSGANQVPLQAEEEKAGGGGGAACVTPHPGTGSKRSLEAEGAGGGEAAEKRPRTEVGGEQKGPAEGGVAPLVAEADTVARTASTAAVAGQGAAGPLQGTPLSQQAQQQWASRGRGGRGRGQERGGHGGQQGRGRGRGAWKEPGFSQQPHWRQPRPASPTLLQKLLAKEIRQDYSYLLQAFRFLVTNNFLLDDTAGKPLEFPRALEVQKAQKDAASVEDVLAHPELAGDLDDLEDEGLEEDFEGSENRVDVASGFALQLYSATHPSLPPESPAQCALESSALAKTGSAAQASVPAVKNESIEEHSNTTSNDSISDSTDSAESSEEVNRSGTGGDMGEGECELGLAVMATGLVIAQPEQRAGAAPSHVLSANGFSDFLPQGVHQPPLPAGISIDDDVEFS